MDFLDEAIQQALEVADIQESDFVSDLLLAGYNVCRGSTVSAGDT